MSKTVEVAADAANILAIVADFESYPQWNEEIKGPWVLARYDDGRASQLRLDAAYEGIEDTLIQAVYYPGANQIQTVMQQGNLFKSRTSVQRRGDGCDVAADGRHGRRAHDAGSRADGQKVGGQRLDYLADNLKWRAEELSS